MQTHCFKSKRLEPKEIRQISDSSRGLATRFSSRTKPSCRKERPETQAHRSYELLLHGRWCASLTPSGSMRTPQVPRIHHHRMLQIGSYRHVTEPATAALI